MSQFTTSHHLLKIFDVLHAAQSTQGAMITVPPGTRDEHPAQPRRWAEQFIYVLAGGGAVQIGNATRKLRPGSLVRVGKHESHVFTTTDQKLVVINIFAPPKEEAVQASAPARSLPPRAA